MHPLEAYINKTGKKYIIFDFDETLFQLHLNWEQYYDDIKDDLIKIDPELYDKFEKYKISWGDFQNVFITKHGEKAKHLFAEKNRHAEKKLLIDAYPNTSLLKTVKSLSHIEKYIWSSNGRDVIEYVLKMHQLEGIFTKIISRTEVGLIKPHPEGFDYIKEPNQKLEEYLFVGDSMADKGAADSLGIEFYYIDYFK